MTSVSYPKLARARRGTNRLAGFTLSTVLLAAAAIIAIPAFIAAGGPTEWGAIATGQAVGSIIAVLIAFGWGMTGPAKIARASRPERISLFRESLLAKSLLALPLLGAAAGLGYLLTGENGASGAVAALSTGLIGLTANWFFAGAKRPYLFLVSETVPRVTGTFAGVALMTWADAPAMVGVLLQAAGMLVAVMVSSMVILWPARSLRDASPSVRRPHVVLGEQRHGVASSVISAIYASAPILIVGLIAPAALPLYALVDKLLRQVNAATAPVITVAQAWVPHQDDRSTRRRARRALVVAAVLSLVGAGMVIVIAPLLLPWLGAGRIDVPFVIIGLMAAVLAVNFAESVTSRAVLTALDRLASVTWASTIGSVAGIAAIVIGALVFGAAGAVGGLLLGFVVRLTIELLVAVRASTLHPAGSPAADIEGTS